METWLDLDLSGNLNLNLGPGARRRRELDGTWNRYGGEDKDEVKRERKWK